MDFNEYEVSKCAETNCSSFDNLNFSLEDVNIEIWVLKAAVQILLLSSLVLDDVHVSPPWKISLKAYSQIPD